MRCSSGKVLLGGEGLSKDKVLLSNKSLLSDTTLSGDNELSGGKTLTIISLTTDPMRQPNHETKCSNS